MSSGNNESDFHRVAGNGNQKAATRGSLETRKEPHVGGSGVGSRQLSWVSSKSFMMASVKHSPNT